MRFDPGQLLDALAGVPPSSWSLPSRYADTGVHHGYRRVPLFSAWRPQPHAGLFGFVWDTVGPVKDATLSSLDPGGFIVPHRDAGPWLHRWQLPIIVSGDWHGLTPVTPESGVLFLARHWEPHAVTNRGTTARIHLVFDCVPQIEADPLPFATFPVPADMADLIERSQQ